MKHWQECVVENNDLQSSDVQVKCSDRHPQVTQGKINYFDGTHKNLKKKNMYDISDLL